MSRRPWVTVLLALALGAGCTPECPEAPGLTAAECPEVRALALDAALPPARGNAFADDPGALLLGNKVFFDARFSSNQDVRCASCHLPESHFADGRAVSQGLTPGRRNSPTLLNAARLRWQGWDGHADSLWSQPLFAFEDPREMDFTRLELAHRIALSFRAPYESVFGPLPPLEDTQRFPPRGAPGMPAWEAMAPADRDAVNRVAANVGKALEAYVRKLAAGRSPLDRHLGGEEGALTDAQREGLRVFVRARCTTCHGGPLLTDERFHALGAPPPDDGADLGRWAGLTALAASPFTARGAYYDGPPPEDAGTSSPTDADRFAFRTPSLRNVRRSPPYGHDGRWATLEDAVEWHLADVGEGGRALSLPAEERAALVDFLGALDGEYPRAPWATWPDR